jgi:hypothetical protein
VQDFKGVLGLWPDGTKEREMKPFLQQHFILMPEPSQPTFFSFELFFL